MTKPNVRNHAVHPPSSVRPNPAINPKPNFVPTEQAALPRTIPNPNPSLGPVGVAAANNMRLNFTDDQGQDCDPEIDDNCDGSDDSDDDEEDRLSVKHAS